MQRSPASIIDNTSSGWFYNTRARVPRPTNLDPTRILICALTFSPHLHYSHTDIDNTHTTHTLHTTHHTPPITTLHCPTESRTIRLLQNHGQPSFLSLASILHTSHLQPLLPIHNPQSPPSHNTCTNPKNLPLFTHIYITNSPHSHNAPPTATSYHNSHSPATIQPTTTLSTHYIHLTCTKLKLNTPSSHTTAPYLQQSSFLKTGLFLLTNPNHHTKIDKK